MANFCPCKNGYALYLDCKECDIKFCEANFVLVVGSRSFTDYSRFEREMDAIVPQGELVVIVSGGAAGADALAKRYAYEHRLYYNEFPAQWKKYGKKAGFLRNVQMHEFISRCKNRRVVAFWDGISKGTEHSFQLSERYCNPLTVIRVEEE